MIAKKLTKTKTEMNFITKISLVCVCVRARARAHTGASIPPEPMEQASPLFRPASLLTLPFLPSLFFLTLSCPFLSWVSYLLPYVASMFLSWGLGASPPEKSYPYMSSQVSFSEFFVTLLNRVINKDLCLIISTFLKLRSSLQF